MCSRGTLLCSGWPIGIICSLINMDRGEGQTLSSQGMNWYKNHAHKSGKHNRNIIFWPPNRSSMLRWYLKKITVRLLDCSHTFLFNQTIRNWKKSYWKHNVDIKGKSFDSVCKSPIQPLVVKEQTRFRNALPGVPLVSPLNAVSSPLPYK